MELEELESSELGTLEYWEAHYKGEIKNFRSHGDVGDIWFGEDILERLICWIEGTTSIGKDSHIADIGCGNGVMLVELARLGFKNLLGLDYSEKAITLAKEIAAKENLLIEYVKCDVLGEEFYKYSFDVMLDKGTYDAISLSVNAKDNKIKYVSNISDSLKENGILVLASCNWTKSELETQFCSKFKIFQVIPTPQFKFGGKTGNVVTCVVFKKI